MSDQNSPFPAPQGGGSSNVYAPPEARVDDVVPEGEVILAERGTRLAAAIIDTIIMFFVAAIVGFAVGIGAFATGNVGFGMQLTIQVASMIGYLAINGYWLAKNGQSVGKKLMGIKIVRSDGSKCPIERIVGLRLLPLWIVNAIPYIGWLAGLIDALCIFRESRKCLHDDIADTIVVKA